jgi:hypothetical protein
MLFRIIAKEGAVTITIGNRLRGDKGFYVGRGSVFGNQNRMQAGLTREEAIERFGSDLLEDCMEHGPMYEALVALRTRVKAGEDIQLVCYCHPLPCHAEVIKHYLECLCRNPPVEALPFDQQ